MSKIRTILSQLNQSIAQSDPLIWTFLSLFFCIAITSAKMWAPNVSQLVLWLIAIPITIGVIFSGVFCVSRHAEDLQFKDLRQWVSLYVQAVVLYGSFFFFISSIYGFDSSFHGLESFEWVNGSYSVKSYLDVFVGFIYFSLVTISTLGYGEIYPTAIWSRLFVFTEVMVGWYIVLFGISRCLSANDSRIER